MRAAPKGPIIKKSIRITADFCWLAFYYVYAWKPWNGPKVRPKAYHNTKPKSYWSAINSSNPKKYTHDGHYWRAHTLTPFQMTSNNNSIDEKIIEIESNECCRNNFRSCFHCWTTFYAVWLVFGCCSHHISPSLPAIAWIYCAFVCTHLPLSLVSIYNQFVLAKFLFGFSACEFIYA